MEQQKDKPNIDFDIVKKVIKLVEESGISSIAIEKGDFKVEVKKESSIHSIPIPIAQEHIHAPSQTVEKGNDKSDKDEGLVAITSPMVGTFYRASSPDSPPYVEEGDEIEKGKVVCIIEAMKLFNEIESEVSGTVVKILVENGSPVEFGQKLMLVKKK